MAGSTKGETKSKPSFALLQKYLTQDGTTDGDQGDLGSSEVAKNIDILLAKIAVKDNDRGSLSISRRVRHLNDLAKVIRHVGLNSSDLNCRIRKIIEHVRLALLSITKEIRAGAMRVLRYVLTSPDIFDIMIQLRIDYLIARSLDTPPHKEIERLQAMRLLRQVLIVCPNKFPHSFIAPLVSIVLSNSEPIDNLTWSGLATLAEVALCNSQLASECSVVKALVCGLLKCQIPAISETVVLTLTHLLNHPETRKFVRTHLDIESLLAPITDTHFHFLVDEVDNSHIKTDREKRVESAKLCMIALLKSWPGFLSLCSPSECGISSFVSMLPLVDSLVRKEILEVFYSIFHLKVPDWTEDYRSAVASIDPSQYRPEWSLEAGWVAEEGESLLPPKVMERVNLLDCYHALLLASLVKAGLFPVLVEVVKKAEQAISVMATILIGELLHIANSILPSEYFSQSLNLPELIASAMSFEVQSERNRSSEVINCLDRVHQLKKQPLKPSSLYLKLTLEQTGYFSGRSTNKELLPTEMDEATLLNHIRDTQVLAVKEYVAWNWNLIFSLLQHPYLTTVPLTEDSLCTKFIRTLTNFYKPSSRQFSSIVYSISHSKRYSAIGLQLVKYLSKTEGVGSGLLHGLVTNIVDQLRQVTASKVTADVFSPSSISHKMARDYFLLLGAVSFHNSSLLQNCKAYGPLLDICSILSRHDLHKLIISSLDFAHDTHARVILQKLLTSGDSETRLYATRHMRVFLRVNAPFFSNWGMEMLIGQLYDLDNEISEEAIDILDEACEEESFLEALVLQHPALLHLSEKGVSLLTRFISVKRGFSLLSRLGHLETELNAWLQDYNFRYVSVVEQRLAERLTSYRHTKEGVYHRRSDLNTFKSQKAFVPVHFYGQLVRQEEGCTLLKEEGHIEKLLSLLRQPPLSSFEIRQIKAAIWALAHIASSTGGLNMLCEDDVIYDLVTMAENSPVLSIRGTCFYALCFISKIPQGADILLGAGWTCVRHSQEEKWPLILEETIEEVATPSSPISPASSVSSMGGGSGGTDLPGDSCTHPLIPRKSTPLLSNFDKEDKKNSQSPMLQKMNTTAGIIGGRKTLISYSLRPVRPIKLASLKKESSASSLDSPKSSGSFSSQRFHFIRNSSLSSIRSGSSGGFVGVALPLDLNGLFVLEDNTYKGSRAESISTLIFDKDHHFLLELVNGDSDTNEIRTKTQTFIIGTSPTQDMTTSSEPYNKRDSKTPTNLAPNDDNNQANEVRRDSSPLMRQKRIYDAGEREKEEPKHDEDNVKVLATSVTSSSTSGSVIFDEQSVEGRLLLHREFLEVIYSLCSDVSLRKNTLHLNILCNKFPVLSQDVELYWKTMCLLSIFQYTLTNRRLIQSKFESLSFKEIFTSTHQKYKTQELSIEKVPIKTDSANYNRRRNSTGEISTGEISKKSKEDIHRGKSFDEYVLKPEEKADTQSMRSMTTTTTASELDMLSEGSLTSNELLASEDGEDEIRESEEGQEEDLKEVVQKDLPSFAEAGNRLSQLEIPESLVNPTGASVVEVLYDL